MKPKDKAGNMSKCPNCGHNVHYTIDALEADTISDALKQNCGDPCGAVYPEIPHTIWCKTMTDWKNLKELTIAAWPTILLIMAIGLMFEFSLWLHGSY